jgi:CRP/FNR family cyclic AMP-dependent transcriptional regulator
MWIGDITNGHKPAIPYQSPTGVPIQPRQGDESAADTVRRAIRTQIASLPLFAGIPERDLDRIAGIVNRKWVPSGYRVLMSRADGDAAYLVIRGIIKLVEDTEDGNEVILTILGTGDLFGGGILIPSRGTSTSVVAMENSVVAIFPRAVFEDLLRTMPALSYNLVGMLEARLQHADERIQALASTHVEARLARVLLDLGQRLGAREQHGVRIPFRLTQAELGSMVGASRVRINHTLGYLRKSGAVTIDGAHIIIVSETLLAAAAHQLEPSDRRRRVPRSE